MYNLPPKHLLQFLPVSVEDLFKFLNFGQSLLSLFGHCIDLAISQTDKSNFRQKSCFLVAIY